ncbi:MAG: UDP-N-acetylmuramoyl-L-alanyl-D-glutamate--LD-lysine ligase [Candidatus Aerophobetes bacterium ADurb.Bin490]|nr:MAG: UDP-N-acetylmuramoyl-L-alanyl-D-glutamate--LD-lysine ligase [Candidatus Aerophobetes bacterium ADurb.Bin490]HPI02450.1 UDP-N-acetylmuramoyl-L-alanyl-D-glutamate--2,6-diaminopimelate ligase [Candidatus Goldiibacteriota bacterium]HRQ43104.1 UDP-N-acetylmuramoyl-L-alanyl-D-glutamate--2,6-diaminopimelate ligase [Candidatus Goldiibacteriota bacterium]
MKTISCDRLAALLGGVVISRGKSGIIKGIEENSGLVKKGTAFFCVPGKTADGHNYALDAESRGACCIVVSREVPGVKSACVIKVDDVREALYKAIDYFYGQYRKKVRVIGITGTKGKTTTAYLALAMLKEAQGKEQAMIGTVEYRIGKRTVVSNNTTPSNLAIHRIIKEAAEKKIKYLVMEVSSHGLDQDRIKNIELASAVITNVTRDHFDYHKNYENYIAAKMKIIINISKNGVLTINTDDAGAVKFLKPAKKAGIKVNTCSLKNEADIYAVEYSVSRGGMEVKLMVNKKPAALSCAMTGEHNISNIMCALSAVVKFTGVKAAVKAVNKFKGVSGRMEIVYSKDITVIVDFAHTADSIEKVLEVMNEIKTGRVIMLFGAGGNKDRGKRPMMGAAAAKLADIVVVTSDNPRMEDPKAIIKDITDGIKRKDGIYVEPDRRKAIKLAVNLAKKDDIVVLAGKGHETYQDIMGKKAHFSDQEQARAAVRNRGKK